MVLQIQLVVIRASSSGKSTDDESADAMVHCGFEFPQGTY